jgi:hypothetical protein
VRFYIGFSYTRFSLVSSVIRAATLSNVSHVFLLVVNEGKWEKVYHYDDGRFECLTLEDFFSSRRVVSSLYRVPVRDMKSGVRAMVKFSTRPKVDNTGHFLRMAYEWLFNTDISVKPSRYCTQVIAEFMLHACTESMVEAMCRVVSPGEMEQWVVDQNWKRINGKDTISRLDVRRLGEAG